MSILRAWLVVAVVAGLVVAAVADAHVTLAPPFVQADAATTVSFETPNERTGRATTSLEIVAPPGVELSAAAAPPGWTLDLSGDRARWTNGRIEGRSTVAFALVITARVRPGTATFQATQGYDDGEVVRWDSALTVLPPSAANTPPQHLRRALLAGAVGLSVIAASFFALRRLRARSLQD